MPAEARLAAVVAGIGSAAAAGACLGHCLATRTASTGSCAGGAAGGEESSAAIGASLLPASLSEFMLEPGLCYLNTGTLGPLPRCVMGAIAAELQRIGANPLGAYLAVLERRCPPPSEWTQCVSK